MDGDDHSAARARVRDQATKLLGADYFALLGVPHGASGEDVNRAFAAAAKTWHPDRVPPGLEDLAPIFTAIFTRLNEARQTLGDGARRLNYLAEMRRSSGAKAAPQGPGAEATLELRKYEVLLKKNDVAAAEQHLRRAIQLAPSCVDYQARLVALVAARPECTRARVEELVGELDKLIARDERCEFAFFTRAQLEKRLDRVDAAVADFARVVQLNPKNLDAQREVRLHEMRRSRPEARAPREPSGPVGRLFQRLTKRR